MADGAIYEDISVHFNYLNRVSILLWSALWYSCIMWILWKLIRVVSMSLGI